MPADGETSDESNDPSLDAIAELKELINSRPRGSSQNDGTEVDAESVDLGVGGCVSAGTGVNVDGGIKIGCGLLEWQLSAEWEAGLHPQEWNSL